MGPLVGTRVLDLSVHLAGPYTAAIMGDMGAEVIRIEKPGGDEDRRIGPEMGGSAILYLMRARNKKSLTLNLHSLEGQAILKQLVKRSDVLIENCGPASRKGLHIEYEELKEVNPGIIVASISGYGSWGPSKDRTAFDAIGQAVCGAMSFSGFPDDERPSRTAVTWVDYSTALQAAVGVLLALIHRSQTGKGQHVDVSLYDSAVNLVGLQGLYTEYLTLGTERPRTGNSTPVLYSDTFRATDGWIFIHLGRDATFKRFARLINREDLVSDPRLGSDALRAQNSALLDRVMNDWVRDKTTAEITALLGKARVPCQKVNRIADVVVDPHLKAREMLVDVMTKGIGAVPTPGIVTKLSESPGEINGGAPSLGEHNQAILGWLGYNDDAIARFKEAGVI